MTLPNVDLRSLDGSVPADRDRASTGTTYPADRLNALSDGVFAIAMTLLALEVRVPEGVTDPARFRALLPQFGGQVALYALAFLIIGRFWMSHHRVSTHVRCVDAVAIRRTIAFLGGVSALPVATALLVHDGQFPEAVAFAAGLLAMTSVLAVALYQRLSRPDLSRLDPAARASVLRRSGLTALVFVSAAPLAYLLPDSSYAPLVWWALPLVGPAARGLGMVLRRRQHHPHRAQQQAGPGTARPDGRARRAHPGNRGARPGPAR